MSTSLDSITRFAFGDQPAAVHTHWPRTSPRLEESLEMPALVDHIVGTYHDYAWARFPFVVPMAVKLARRLGRGSAPYIELASAVIQLWELMKPHLDRDHQLLASLAGRGALPLGAAELGEVRAEHAALARVVGRVRAAAVAAYPTGVAAGLTERALLSELSVLDRHICAQVRLEEHAFTRRSHPRPRALGTSY